MRIHHFTWKKAASLFIILLLFCSVSISEASDTKADLQAKELKEMTRDEVANLIQSKINEENGNELIFIDQFIPSDKSSSHYRTEFRLNAFSKSSGYAYGFGNASFDIIISDSYFDKNIVRIYVDNATLKECCNIINIVSPILDKKLTEQELAETIDYIKRQKEANGYYYSDLGLLLLGNDVKGYSLMLKME